MACIYTQVYILHNYCIVYTVFISSARSLQTVYIWIYILSDRTVNIGLSMQGNTHNQASVKALTELISLH